MIEIDTLHDRAARLETLMQEKLGGGGKTLAKRFARAGRRLPNRIQRAGRAITEAQAASAHPKLARLHDAKTLDAAFTEITAHLKQIDPVDRRKGVLLGVTGGLVFNLILLFSAIVGLLYWQGVL